MHLYDVGGPGLAALPVFATNYNEAAEVALTWWITRHYNPLPDLEVRRRSIRSPGLHFDHLCDALDRMTVGVGQYDPDAGWTIRSPGQMDQLS